MQRIFTSAGKGTPKSVIQFIQDLHADGAKDVHITKYFALVLWVWKVTWSK